MRYRNFAVIAVVLLFTSCEQLKYFTRLNFVLPFSREFAAPQLDTGTTLPPEGLVLSLPEVGIVTNSEESLQKFSISKEQIAEVNLRSFSELANDSAGHCNFNFVDSLNVYISARGLPEVLMAEQNNIPDNADSVSFDCIAQNLKDYFMKDTIMVRMQGRFYKVPKQAKYKTDFKFGIVANVLDVE